MRADTFQHARGPADGPSKASQSDIPNALAAETTKLRSRAAELERELDGLNEELLATLPGGREFLNAAPSSLLSVIFYDDRYNETRDRHNLAIYRSLDRGRVPFIVGRPMAAVAHGEGRSSPSAAAKAVGSDGRPGEGPTMRGKLNYRPGAKVSWLMRTLPLVKSEFAFLLDTDTIWLCSASEVIHKRAQLLRELNAGDNGVLLFGERSMWPPHQHFRGIHLRLNQTDGYPPAEKGFPFRYINAGAALGRPRDLLALHKCMEQRYVGFPDACPAGHTPRGELRYYSANNAYQPPVLDRPLHSRDYKYHGLRLKGSNWGWEQGCFHMYYLEHRKGELPASCPPIILDRAGRCMVHLAGVSQRSLKWNATTPRVSFNGEQPCVLHANGPAKKALKSIWRWWENPGGEKPHWS